MLAGASREGKTPGRLLRFPQPARRPPDESPPPGMGRFGLALFLASLAMLFGASLVGYVVTRLHAPAWPPPGAPPLPRTLWLSTALALAISVTVQRAVGRIRAGDKAGLTRWLRFALLCALAFLAAQAASWVRLTMRGLPAGRDLYAFTFYFLTALHALHVLGGLVPLGFTAWRAARRHYGRDRHDGVALVAIYWHFLTAVWLVIFGALYLAG